jgi:hypothetical protein
VFVIESGRVPSTPMIHPIRTSPRPRLARADGSTVYIDVQGTLKPEGQLPAISSTEAGSWRSCSGRRRRPVRTKSAAAAGLLAAGSAAVGGAAPIVGELLADSPLSRVEFRTATYEGRSSYTAAVRITENVWFETTYRSRETGQNATAEKPDVSGTIDWRFLRNWSWRTEIGTLGTGMDLLWQYRY